MNKIITTGDLGKWPRLVAIGKRVSREQADDIIFRTTTWMPSTNDRNYEKHLLEITGFPKKIDYSVEQKEGREAYVKHVNEVWDKQDKWRKAHMVVEDLQYLHTDRIASCWVGGPHGWINWNGNIACGNYNVGKRPEPKELLEDCQILARSFPFLEMDMLFLAEEGEGPEVLHFVISKGEVTSVKPDLKGALDKYRKINQYTVEDVETQLQAGFSFSLNRREWELSPENLEHRFQMFRRRNNISSDWENHWFPACPSCGSKEHVQKSEKVGPWTIAKEGEISVEVDVYGCISCGFYFPDATEEMRELFESKAFQD